MGIHWLKDQLIDSNLFTGSLKKKELVWHIAFILTWAFLTHYPFIYVHGASEGDSFVLANGIIDAINKGNYFSNKLLVFDFYSFGYYWLIFKLQPFFASGPAHLFSLMNNLSFICVFLTTLPLYLFIKDIWGPNTALYSLIIYHLVPSVFETASYGHPATAAWFFTVLALYLIQRALTAEADQQSRIFLGLAAVSNIISMCLRTDAFFLTLPLLFGLLYYYRELNRRWLLRFFYFTAGSLIAFSALQYAVIGATWNALPLGAFFTDLNKFHVTDSVPARLARGAVVFALAVGPLAALLAPAVFIYLYKRQRDEVILLAAWVIPIVLFWLPFPTPARHFLYAIPGVVTAIACSLTRLGKKYASLLAAVFILLNYYSPLPLYRPITSRRPQLGLAPGRKQVSFNVPLLPVLENHYYLQKELNDYWDTAQALSKIEDKSVVLFDNFVLLAINALISQKPAYHWSGRVYYNVRDNFTYNMVTTPGNQYVLVSLPTGADPAKALAKFKPRREFSPYHILLFPRTRDKYPALRVPEGYEALEVQITER